MAGNIGLAGMPVAHSVGTPQEAAPAAAFGGVGAALTSPAGDMQAWMALLTESVQAPSPALEELAEESVPPESAEVLPFVDVDWLPPALQPPVQRMGFMPLTEGGAMIAGAPVVGGSAAEVTRVAVAAPVQQATAPVREEAGGMHSAALELSEPNLDSVMVASPRMSSAAMAAPSVRTELPAVSVRQNDQPLAQALAQRIQVQQVQGAEVATVRLDPPQMGSLEIRIRQDSTGIQVQMQASHAEVGRQLTSVVEHLRQELQQRSPDVQVSVSQGRSSMGSGQGGAHQQQQQASADADVYQALEDGAASALT